MSLKKEIILSFRENNTLTHMINMNKETKETKQTKQKIKVIIIDRL